MVMHHQHHYRCCSVVQRFAVLQLCVLRPQAEMRPEGPKIEAAGRNQGHRPS